MSSIASLQFSCTTLLGTNKVGDLKADADGYYEMVVGALNMFNSKKEFYTYEAAKRFFTDSADLMRRVDKGVLRGEYGHPSMDAYLGLPEQQRQDAWFQRLYELRESEICCHHMKLWLDFDRVRDKDGNKVIAIISKVKPSGPRGPILEKQLQNKNENVCFSIRSFANRRRFGNRVYKDIVDIVTFDYVNEGGMLNAQKYLSPALESMESHEMEINRTDLTLIRRSLQKNDGSSLESARIGIDGLFRTMGWDQSAIPDMQRFMQW